MEFNPFAPENRENPYPMYRLMRDRHPAYYDEGLGAWSLTRFADVSGALQDPALYSSAQGIGGGMDSERGQMAANMLQSLIMTDPPRHTRLRSLVNRAFTPRRINALEGRIREIATQLIDDIVDRGSCDLVADLTGPLPTITIAELLGVPAEDHKMFKEKSNALLNRPPEQQRAMGPEAMVPILELTQYLNRIYDQRREEPRDDLMSALLEAEIEGQRLTGQELMGFALLLLIAGNETTPNLISNGLVLLHDHPDQRALLQRDPSRIPTAIEEFLRFESPVPGIGRALTDDVRLHGQDLRKGQRVMLLFGAANRDERQFEDPDRLDITRQPTQHLAFGFGTHFCLGASLARLEARVAFEELFARLPELTLLRDRAERNQGGIRGYASLPARP